MIRSQKRNVILQIKMNPFEDNAHNSIRFKKLPICDFDATKYNDQSLLEVS